MIGWFEKHRKISWVLTILIAIAIFYTSTLTFPPSQVISPWKSISYHFIAFFILGFFLLISLVKGRTNKNLIFLGLIIAVLYGISDEIHQIFVSNRFFDLADILTDSAGILFSGVLYSLHCNRYYKKSKLLQSH